MVRVVLITLGRVFCEAGSIGTAFASRKADKKADWTLIILKARRQEYHNPKHGKGQDSTAQAMNWNSVVGKPVR